MELVSVIVPIFNREGYLVDTIESIRSQSYENLEILLIDDGSKDKSYKIIKEYEKKDRRIKSFTSENRGICSVMKFGVLVASGDFVARCDSDDICEKDRYDLQIKYLKEGDYDLIGCYINSFGSGDHGQKKYLETCVNRSMDTEKEVRERFLLGQALTGSTLFGKRESLLNIMPFNDDYSIIEDYYLGVMMHINNMKLSILKDKVLNYRVHDNNLSLNNGREILRKHTEISFLYIFGDMIRGSKRVFIFRMKNDSDYIKEIIYKHFYDIKERFYIINEEETIDFINNNSFILREICDNIVFYGVNFRYISEFLIKTYKYKLYTNIFLSGN